MSTPEQFHQEVLQLKDVIIDRVMVMRLSNAALVIIRERTLKGQFLEGSSPDAGEYSTKPFAMPYAAVATNSLKRELRRNTETGVLFRQGNKQLWIVVKGGYKKYRELAGKDTSKATLTWTGRMMRNLGILNADDSSAILGMKDADTKQLALYHNVMGAGKSKKKRVFMGLTEAEKIRLAKFAGEEFLSRINVK
ncbi:hypothetical protein [Zoogloea sp.]|uniref:hypothetical protein n=1 Tax=Zoogloea sp. TaxID=49181 RepID=UPI00141652BD|nr:MAG: hypothetical protein F9K15_12790 [Zoogloea sp.]